MNYLGYHGEYKDDILRIQRVCLQNCWELTLMECMNVWEAYSSDMCAGWMCLDGYSDEELWDIIKEYLPRF